MIEISRAFCLLSALCAFGSVPAHAATEPGVLTSPKPSLNSAPVTPKSPFSFDIETPHASRSLEVPSVLYSPSSRLQPETAQTEAGNAQLDNQPQSAGGAADLAKQLSNPIASLISVPFQFNYDEGYGTKDAGRFTLNIQPVIPFSISEKWNLITRTIVPVIHQDSTADGLDSDSGLGDTVQSFFFSPKEPVGSWIIGAGPVALWPTGTDPQLRSESLGFGPTIVALRQQRGWTFGVLANHIWSVTHSDDHGEVNATFLQPFVAHTWPSATTLALNVESTYDWSSSEWTIPLNLQLAQVVSLGRQPVQFQIGGRYYAESPDNGPEWGLRFTITFLFPE